MGKTVHFDRTAHKASSQRHRNRCGLPERLHPRQTGLAGRFDLAAGGPAVEEDLFGSFRRHSRRAWRHLGTIPLGEVPSLAPGL